DVQRQLEDLEKKKAELESLSTVLASAKESESEHKWLGVMAAKFAEQGDFTKAIEHLEKAIEIAKAKKHYGIGIAIGKTDGLIKISEVLPDAPPSGSSFQQGDIIEAVDGVSTEGMSLDEVVARIVGPKGTKVTLTVKSHSQDVTMKETFTRQLLLEGSQALRAYEWRLAAYKAGKTVDEYRKMMEKSTDRTAGAPRIFELRYASAEELAKVLSRILERRWKGIKDKPANVVRIIPDPDTNRLIVLASPADNRLIEALIAELDVLAEQDSISVRIMPRIEPKSDTLAESTVTQIIALKYADCKSIEEKLMILFPDDQFRIVSDERTNTLIVVGTEPAIEKIKTLIFEIDVSVSDKNLEIKAPEKQR
ncbi:MAG: secretin N-terminal domain-containing protein, partial [Sedimentisphaerales bacterium]